MYNVLEKKIFLKLSLNLSIIIQLQIDTLILTQFQSDFF